MFNLHVVYTSELAQMRYKCSSGLSFILAFTSTTFTISCSPDEHSLLVWAISYLRNNLHIYFLCPCAISFPPALSFVAKMYILLYKNRIQCSHNFCTVHLKFLIDWLVYIIIVIFAISIVLQLWNLFTEYLQIRLLLIQFTLIV